MLDIHGCRVAKGLAEVALDIVLRRQVELLKELGRDGNATGRAHSVESIAGMHVFVEVRVITAAVVAVVAITTIQAIRAVVLNVPCLVFSHLARSYYDYFLDR